MHAHELEQALVPQDGETLVFDTNPVLNERVTHYCPGCHHGIAHRLVSEVLHELGVENTALGFVAGFTGCELEHSLARRGVRTEFVRLAEGQTRINVKVKGQEETEINAAGPVIPPEAQRRLLEQLDALQAGDVLVVSGSVPASMPGGSYETLLPLS